MSYRERITSVVDNMDLGIPMFKVRLRGDNVIINEAHWDPKLDKTDFIEGFVNRFAIRHFDKENRKYSVDTEKTIEEIEQNTLRKMIDIFIETSPNAKPRRTNVYRKFVEIVHENKHVDEFKVAMFNIYEYYFNNTQTESITSTKNDVHRTNIYQLLCLMEKSYGKQR